MLLLFVVWRSECGGSVVEYAFVVEMQTPVIVSSKRGRRGDLHVVGARTVWETVGVLLGFSLLISRV